MFPSFFLPSSPSAIIAQNGSPVCSRGRPTRVDDRLSVALAVVPLLPPTIGQTAHQPMACPRACSYEWHAARLLFRRSSRIPANLRCTSASPRRPYSSKPPPACCRSARRRSTTPNLAPPSPSPPAQDRSEEHTSELQSR